MFHARLALGFAAVHKGIFWPVIICLVPACYVRFTSAENRIKGHTTVFYLDSYRRPYDS